MTTPCPSNVHPSTISIDHHTHESDHCHHRDDHHDHHDDHHHSMEHLLLSNRVDDSGGKILQSVCENGHHNLEATHDSGKDCVKAVCDSTVSLLHAQLSDEKNHGDTRRLIEHATHEIKSAVQDNHSAIILTAKENTIELLKAKCDLERQASDNKTCLSKQICELKEVTTSQHCKLKQLIRELDANRLRDALEACKTENLILRLCKGMGTSPSCCSQALEMHKT